MDESNPWFWVVMFLVSFVSGLVAAFISVGLNMVQEWRQIDYVDRRNGYDAPPADIFHKIARRFPMKED